MRCNQCGEEVDIFGWKYCPKCGGGLSDEKLVNYVAFFFKSKRNIYLSFGIVLIFFAFLTWNLYAVNKEAKQKQQELEDFTKRQGVISVEWKPAEKIVPLIAANNNVLGKLKISSQKYGQLRVELEAEGITEKKSEIIAVRPETVETEIGALISQAGYARLWLGPQSTKLRIKVQDETAGINKVILENEKDIFFNSVNEMIWKQDGVSNAEKSLRLVNKDNPAVVELVRKAAQYVADYGGTKDAMLGYFSQDEKEIKAQIAAIFRAVQKDYQIRYISSPFSYNGPEIQRIKSPEQVIATKSGICIDLSLLMVAAFENLGFDPVLVFTSSHVWPGIELGYGSGKFFFIESTALTETPLKAMTIAEKSWKIVNDKTVPITFDLIRAVDARSKGILPFNQ